MIFALLAWGLAASRFPAAYPHYGTAAYVAAGLLTAVAFFASLLAHELSHALVARPDVVRAHDLGCRGDAGVGARPADLRPGRP